MRIVELIAIVIILVGITFVSLHWPYGMILTLIGCYSLAGVYLLGSRSLFLAKLPSRSNHTTLQRILAGVVGATIGFLVLSILSQIMVDNDALTIGKIAFWVLGALSVLLIITKFVFKIPALIQATFPRLVVIGGLVLLFYFSPFWWVDHHLNHDSKSNHLLKELLKDPTNDSIQEAYSERKRYYLDSGNADGWQSESY